MKFPFSLLRPDAPKGAEQLRLAVADMVEQIAAKRDAVADAETRRHALHLDESATSADFDRADKAIVVARREHERAVVLHGELARRHEDVSREEALDGLIADRLAAEQEATDVVDFFKHRYPDLATEIVTWLDRLDAVEKAAAAINARHRALDFDDRIPPVDHRFAADPPLEGARRFAMFVKHSRGVK